MRLRSLHEHTHSHTSWVLQVQRAKANVSLRVVACKIHPCTTVETEDCMGANRPQEHLPWQRRKLRLVRVEYTSILVVRASVRFF